MSASATLGAAELAYGSYPDRSNVPVVQEVRLLDGFILALALGLAASLLVLASLYRMWRKARSELRDVLSSRQSLSTKYGKMTEQFMPFLSMFPWNPERFRFIGAPIDGIQFEDDVIVLVEFKTGSSRLSRTQRQVRDLVREGRVEFREVRLD